MHAYDNTAGCTYYLCKNVNIDGQLCNRCVINIPTSQHRIFLARSNLYKEMCPRSPSHLAMHVSRNADELVKHQPRRVMRYIFDSKLTAGYLFLCFLLLIALHLTLYVHTRHLHNIFLQLWYLQLKISEYHRLFVWL